VNVVPVTDEIQASDSFRSLRQARPEFLFHDAISNEYWGRLYTERPEFQVDVDREQDLARYVEPNVWMRHAVVPTL
jgi:hypothetical protein